jgi:hypothetical protein
LADTARRAGLFCGDVPVWRPAHADTGPRQGGDAMITFVRTVSIAPGKIPEAMAFAHQVAKMIKEKFGSEIRLSVPIGGNPNRIGFVVTYANLSEFDAMTTKLVADGEYMKLIVSNGHKFLPGSIFDELWRSI